MKFINTIMREKSQKKVLAVTFFLFMFSFIIEPMNLNVGNIVMRGHSTIITYLLTKCLFFLFLWIIILGIKKIFIEKVYGNEVVIIFCVIMTVYLVFYLLVYPGIWMNDAKLMYDLALNFQSMIGQHYITTLMYLFVLMLIPNAAAIPLIYVFFCSVMASYIVYKFWKIVQKKKLSKIYIILISVILVLPPVLFMVVFPLRNVIFGFLMTCIALTIQDIEFSGLRKTNFHLLNLVVAIMSALRSEAVLIFIVYLGFMFVISLKYLKTKKYILGLIAFFILIKLGGGLFYSPNEAKVYRMTPFISPLSCMVSSDQLKITQDEIQVIEEIVSIDLLKKYADHLGAHILYNEDKNNWNRFPADKEYYAFIKAYTKIVFRNLNLFLKIRWKTFLALNRINMNYLINNYRPGEISSENYPINSGTIVGFARHKVIDFLYFLDYKEENIGNNNYPVHILVWGNWIPLALNIIGLLITWLKRKWILSFSLIIPLIQAVAVFLLVLTPYPMFAFPFYLGGLVLPIYVILKLRPTIINKFEGE